MTLDEQVNLIQDKKELSQNLKKANRNLAQSDQELKQVSQKFLKVSQDKELLNQYLTKFYLNNEKLSKDKEQLKQVNDELSEENKMLKSALADIMSVLKHHWANWSASNIWLDKKKINMNLIFGFIAVKKFTFET